MNYKEGSILSYRQMIDYILDNQLSDFDGMFDYNDAKNIASASDTWKLTKINLNNFDWICDKNYNNKSTNTYPIIRRNIAKINIFDKYNYEVLDGKHRIGMYNYMGKKEILVWLGL